MSVREDVNAALNTLNDAELQQVAEFVAFVRFRSRVVGAPKVEAEAVAALYAEAAEEDRYLAEAGMEAYGASVAREDRR